MNYLEYLVRKEGINMLNHEEIEILELDPPKEKRQEVKVNLEVQNSSKIVPFFLVCVLILAVTQIVIFTIVAINNI